MSLLRIFDHLGRLRDLDAAGPMGSGVQNAVVEPVHRLRRFGGGAGGDLENPGQRVFPVPRIDPFGTVSAEEIPVEAKSAVSFQDGNALLLGAAGEDGAFIDDDRAGMHRFPDRFAGQTERPQVGGVVFVHRRRNGHNEHIPVAQFLRISGAPQAFCRAERLRRDFQSRINALPEFFQTAFLDVESDRVVIFSEFRCEGESDVAESDQSNLQFSVSDFFQYFIQHGDLVFPFG